MNNMELNEEIEEVVQLAEELFGNGDQVRERIQYHLQKGLEIEEAVIEKKQKLF